MPRSVNRGHNKRGANKFRFKYNSIRRKYRKSKKGATAQNEAIKSAWNSSKTAKQNLEGMGLMYDLNKFGKSNMENRDVEEMDVAEAQTLAGNQRQKIPTSAVCERLEKEAKAEMPRTLRLSQTDLRFCIRMMEKHGSDYEAMSFDPLNHYQLTAAQIKRKIELFKTIPPQYNAYLRAKGIKADSPSNGK